MTMWSLLTICAICLDNVICGPVVDDMVIFLANCPELACREDTLHVFKLCCLCLGHIFPVLPGVRLHYPISGVESVDLSSVIEPLQNYLLCGEMANNFFQILSQLQCVWSWWISLETRRFEQDMIYGRVFTFMGGTILWRDCRSLTKLFVSLVTWIPVP